ncbi:MAG: hypothetical protein [Caudoviricetes sp.]|nr:MAG: hypothetical protein [Caudoviricetes sp.]
MGKITIELPDHLLEDFLGWVSNSGEQYYMEAYKMGDNRENTFVDFSYPGFKDKIVITELDE